MHQQWALKNGGCVSLPRITMPIPAGKAVAPPLIMSGNASYQQYALTPGEEAIFYRDLSRMAQMYAFQRDLADLLLDDAETFESIAGIAKGSIGTNPTFNGLNAQGNEIGMQKIRAITVQNPGIAPGGTPVLDWVRTYVNTGWTDLMSPAVPFFGEATNKIDLSQSGTGGSSATNTRGRVVLAINALLNTATSPKPSEVKITIGSLSYPVFNIDWEPATNIFFARLPGVILIPVDGNFYINADIQPATGEDATQLFGLAFATGNYLSAEV